MRFAFLISLALAIAEELSSPDRRYLLFADSLLVCQINIRRLY